MAQAFDVVVIGGGPGGYVCAIRAAQLELKVACIDRRGTFGGTCLNVGCIPSKALLDSSELYAQARSHFDRHGIQLGSVSLDLPTMLRRKDQVVKTLVDGVAGLLKKNGVTAFRGSGKLVAAGQVEFTPLEGGEPSLLEAQHIVLATGSAPVELPFLKFDGQRIVSSTEALTFETVPEHLIVVGGGYIGLELGSVWARLGSKVTVVEFLPRILPLTDTEVAGKVQKSLEKQGLTFHLGTKVTGAKVEGDRVTVSAEQDGKPLTFTGDRVLVSVGRRTVTDGLGLDAVGVKVEKGKVVTDGHFRTNVAGIYAVGDLIDGPMLAHKASEEGVALAEQLAGKPGHVNYDAIPSVIYIWPEVAAVGLTEEQVKETGKPYKVGKFPFAASGRARSMDETEGFVKILTDAATDRVIGVHIFGPRASDMIAEAVTILEFRGSAEDIARITHAHPTLSESMAEAARAASFGKALHI